MPRRKKEGDSVQHAHHDHTTHHTHHHTAEHHTPEHHVHHATREPEHHATHHNAAASENMHHLQQKIIENLVQLQKVHTHLAERFDNLSTQLSSLLGLFESAAKSFAIGVESRTGASDKELTEKLDRILEQNRILAKGVTLMEEKLRERMNSTTSPPASPPPSSSYAQLFAPSPSYPRSESQRVQDQQEQSQDEQMTTDELEKREGYEPSINRPLPKF